MDNDWKFERSFSWFRQFTRRQLDFVVLIVLGKVDKHHEEDDQLENHVDHGRHVTICRFRAKLLLKLHDTLNSVGNSSTGSTYLTKG